MRTAVMITAALMFLSMACTGETPKPAAWSVAAAQAAAQQEAPEGTFPEEQLPKESPGRSGHEPQPVAHDTGDKPEKGGGGDRHETVTVTGQGAAAGQPDIVRLHLGALSRGKDPTELAGEVMRATAALVQAAVRNGVDEADIRTKAFRIRENLRYDPVEHRQRREGFKAYQQTTVTVRDPDSAGTIMAELIESAGSPGKAQATVQGVNAELEDPEPPRLEALEAAAQNM